VSSTAPSGPSACIQKSLQGSRIAAARSSQAIEAIEDIEDIATQRRQGRQGRQGISLVAHEGTTPGSQASLIVL
jgi:hypothetical protein